MRKQRGKQRRPAKVGVYGVEGVGKTTLISQCPRVLFLDTEDGCCHYDVDAWGIDTWADMRTAFRELRNAKDREYDTIAIDSIDRAEALLEANMCREEGRKSIEDWGYGKGYKVLADKFGTFLDGATALMRKGYNIVLIGHSQVKRHNDPTIAADYDRYEIKLTKQCAPLLKEWCDALLFLNFDTAVKVAQDDKPRGIGGKDRKIYTSRAAAYDAKNRYGLPDEMACEYASISRMFETTSKEDK